MTERATGREWRDVPLDVLREWARDLTEQTSQRAFADRAGLGRTTVAKFVAGQTAPHARTRRALGLLYVADSAGLPPALNDALSLLLADVPQEGQDEARRKVLALVRELQERTGRAAAGVDG